MYNWGFDIWFGELPPTLNSSSPLYVTANDHVSISNTLQWSTMEFLGATKTDHYLLYSAIPFIIHLSTSLTIEEVHNKLACHEDGSIQL
jgi:hypothetical protein